MSITRDQQTYLVTLLSFGDKLLAKDHTITDEVATLNSFTYNDDDVNQIIDILQNHVEKATTQDYEFLSSVIGGLTMIDNAYLQAQLDLSIVDITDIQKLRSFISTALAANKTFGTSHYSFSYYKRLSMLAIITKDRVLLRNAIDYVQGLQVV